jgi:hypothetical protein
MNEHDRSNAYTVIYSRIQAALNDLYFEGYRLGLSLIIQAGKESFYQISELPNAVLSTENGKQLVERKRGIL